MKKHIIFAGFLFLLAGIAAAQIGPGRILYVSVKTIQLKSSTGLMAGTTGTLDYGEQVTVLQVNGKFVEVRSAENESLKGWTASDNFTTKRIITGSEATASAKEVALAGKGFNQEIEDSYRAKGELNYDEVDRMETFTADETRLAKFLEEGRLRTGEQ